jgi:hypothetical protein
MALYDEEDVLAITNDEEIICRHCMTEDDWDSIEGGSEVVTHFDIDGEIIYCDQCKRRIS